ncbi:hypothetical protein M3Y98_01047100 [Aphelenchoides besseyi]|nr:hypothetical protein M3Y98_01044000 [Aphelenchoides besseyi]KAI6173112.1 hypothetical protein M3Y98_01047100 [Aphelenchoides besseyi]KAI6209827.1 hypothetical protein M3Y96_00262500 [Aphelenchoides besseyi]
MLLSKAVVFTMLAAVHTKDIKCLRCSYFAPQLQYLAANLSDQINQAKANHNLTMEERDIVIFTERALHHQNKACLYDPNKLQADTLECQYNTCARQLIRKKTGMKTAASGCASMEDEELIWTMCVCHHADSCEIEPWSPSEANQTYNWTSLFILTFTVIQSV